MKTLSLTTLDEKEYKIEGYPSIECNLICNILVDKEYYCKLLVCPDLPKAMGMGATINLQTNENIVLANDEFFELLTQKEILQIIAHEIGHIELNHAREMNEKRMSKQRLLEIELEADKYACDNFYTAPTLELYNKTILPLLAFTGDINIKVKRRIMFHFEARKRALDK